MIQGFVSPASTYDDFVRDTTTWLAEGAIRYKEQVVEGLEANGTMLTHLDHFIRVRSAHFHQQSFELLAVRSSGWRQNAPFVTIDERSPVDSTSRRWPTISTTLLDPLVASSSNWTRDPNW